jgi:hypothetical protein
VSEWNEADDEARELEEAVEREYQAAKRRAFHLSRTPGMTHFVTPRATIRKRLIAERREAQDARLRDLQERTFEQQLAEGRKLKRGPHPKEYEGGLIERAVRLAAAGDGRNAIAKKTELSTYAVDRILELVETGELADAGERGRLVIPGEMSVTPAFITLNTPQGRF